MAGKKGKKGGKKGKSGKKGKKAKEPQMTAKEAILAYQINIIEKKLEDMNYETRGWVERNMRHVARNNKLKSEQELLIEHLLKQAKDVEKIFAGEGIKQKGDVILSMKDKWLHQRALEDEFKDLENEIKLKDDEIFRRQREVQFWINYKDKGQFQHSSQIKVIQQELNDMQMSFDQIAGHLSSSLDRAKDEIEKYTEDTLDKQKFLASEKAMGQLDKHSRQEVLDNDWLKREVEIHSNEATDMLTIVEDLERGNLEIMSELFECKVDDLKISRNFYLTQFEDSENLDETGILEMDLAKLNFGDKDSIQSVPESAGGAAPSSKKSRPKSATQKAIENKVFSLVTARAESEEESGAEGNAEDNMTIADYLDHLYFEEEDFSDYLQLGPLELKLLSVTGCKMTIHNPAQPTQEEIEAKECSPDDWPVTAPMLNEFVTPRA